MIKDLLPWRKPKENEAPARRSDVFGDLQREMNDLFDSFMGDADDAWNWPSLSRRGGGWPGPKFDVSETDDKLEVTAELPGMDEKDVDVNLDGNILTIKGEVTEEKEDKTYHLKERRSGSFQRSLSVPESANLDKVEAKFKKGVLKITFPKTEEAKSRKRTISVTS